MAMYQHPLGDNQKMVLRILPWRKGDRVWVSPSLTRRVLATLAKRGLVEEVDGVWQRC